MSFFHRPKTLTKNEAGKPFRTDIQALRAFAVVAVVLYHLWPNRLEGGFTGVDIFFVISGYLMTISVMRRLAVLRDKRNITIKSSLSLLAGFYARRIRRLVPAALTVVTAVLGLSWLTGNLNVILTNAKNAFTAATFWQNWYLANDSLNYLQQDNLIVATQHFWSLSLEEQFYLIWPLLLILSTVITTGVVILYKKHRIHGLIMPLTLVALGSLAYGIYLTQSEPTVAYYSTPARIWELMLGGLIALLPAIKHYDLKLLLPYIGLAINLYSIFFITGEGFPGWNALLPTIGTAMILWAGVDRSESKLSFTEMFKWRPIQWVGNISYSVYLWHFPLIIFLPMLLHHDINGEYGRLFKIGIIIASLAIAHLSYILIEKPTQRLNLKTWKYYLLFILATAIVAGSAYGIKVNTEQRIDNALKEMHSQALDHSNKCFGARAIVNEDKCGDPYGKRNPSFMSINALDTHKGLISRNKKRCENMFKQTKPSKDLCTAGDLSAKKSIILVGDSHAQQYMNAFDYIGQKLGYKIILVDYTGCPSLLRDPSIVDNTKAHESCLVRYDTLKKLPSFIEEPSLIVISYLYHSFIDMQANILFIKNLYKNSNVVLLKDNPHGTPREFTTCSTIGGKSCKLNKHRALNHITDVEGVINNLVKHDVISKRSIIDTTDFFCRNETCYQSIGGVPVYTNTYIEELGGNKDINAHITGSYSYSLGPLIERDIVDNGLLAQTK